MGGGEGDVGMLPSLLLKTAFEMLKASMFSMSNVPI